MAYQFILEDNEAVFVLQVLSELPTRSNAFPLWVKLSEQAKAQAPEVQAVEETPEEK